MYDMELEVPTTCSHTCNVYMRSSIGPQLDTSVLQMSIFEWNMARLMVNNKDDRSTPNKVISVTF